MSKEYDNGRMYGRFTVALLLFKCKEPVSWLYSEFLETDGGI